MSFSENATLAEMQAHYAAVQARLYGTPRRAIVPLDRVRPEIRDALVRSTTEEQARQRACSEARRRELVMSRIETAARGRALVSLEEAAAKTGLSRRLHCELIDLLQPIADRHDVSIPTVLGSSRRAYVMKARWECIAAVSRAYPRWSLIRIGQVFGGRDHTTILHALRRIGAWPREGSR